MCQPSRSQHFTAEWKHLLLSNIYKLERNVFFLFLSFMHELGTYINVCTCVHKDLAVATKKKVENSILFVVFIIIMKRRISLFH